MNKIGNAESQYLYMLKGIACYLVVFVHFGMDYAGGFYELTRIAVPIFFIIQGRFLAVQIDGKDTAVCRRKNWSTLIRIFKTTIIVSLMYILFSYILWVVCAGMELKQWFLMKFSLIEWMKLLFFNSSKIIYDNMLIYDHQWYLYAAMSAILIFIILQKYLNKFTLVLFIVPMLLRLINQYTFNIFEDGLWCNEYYIEKMCFTRNSIVTALPFMAVGMLLQYIDRTKIKESICKIWKVILLVGVIGGIVLTYVEYAFFETQELYIGSVIVAVCATTFGRFIDMDVSSVITWIGKWLSKDIFYWHPLVQALLWRLYPIDIDPKINPFYICLCTSIVALIMLGIKRFMKEKDKLLIKLIFVIGIFAILFSGAFYLYASNVSEIPNMDFIELENSELVKLRVKEVYEDENGNVTVKVLAKNENISYEFHNWTLGDGKGFYKNVQIAIVQNNKMFLGNTYPFGVGVSEDDIQAGFSDADGCICYMRDFELTQDYKIAVVFTDRDNKQYIIYQE